MGKEKKNPIRVVEKVRIRKVGVFDYRKVHAHIHSFFTTMGYSFAETKHAEKMTGSGRDIESEWSASRKVDSYVKFKISIAIILKDYKEVTVEENGKDVKTGNGRLEMIFNAEMEKNYAKLFSEKKGEFSNALKELYEKYLAKEKLDKYEDKLMAETLSLYENIKMFTS